MTEDWVTGTGRAPYTRNIRRNTATPIAPYAGYADWFSIPVEPAEHRSVTGRVRAPLIEPEARSVRPASSARAR